MHGRTYRESEIRAIRMLLITIFAIGAFALIGGFANLHKWPSKVDHNNHEYLKATAHQHTTAKQQGSYRNVPLMYFIMATTFLSLSTAGMIAVRRVIANGMQDVEFDLSSMRCQLRKNNLNCWLFVRAMAHIAFASAPLLQHQQPYFLSRRSATGARDRPDKCRVTRSS